MSIDVLIGRLTHVKEVTPRRGHRRSWLAKCPAHDDNTPSLYVDEAQNGKPLIKCWTGCGAVDVLHAAGLEGWGDILEKTPLMCAGPGRRKPEISEDRLTLEIMSAARGRGEPISESDKKAELAAFQRLNR